MLQRDLQVQPGECVSDNPPHRPGFGWNCTRWCGSSGDAGAPSPPWSLMCACLVVCAVQAKGTWKCVSSPQSPAPRCSHQVRACPVLLCLSRWSPWCCCGVQGRFRGRCNAPPACCASICVQAIVYKDFMYIFGGEFATSKQFYHHRDTWKLNLSTNRWVPPWFPLLCCTGV